MLYDICTRYTQKNFKTLSDYCELVMHGVITVDAPTHTIMVVGHNRGIFHQPTLSTGGRSAMNLEQLFKQYLKDYIGLLVSEFRFRMVISGFGLVVQIYL